MTIATNFDKISTAINANLCFGEMIMKKLLCIIISSVLISSAALTGCDFIIPDIKNETSSATSDVNSDSDDSIEVEFHFSTQDQDDTPSRDNNPLPKIIEPTTCPLSDSTIQDITNNADSIISQYPDFSGTVLMSSGNRIIYEKSFGTTDGKTPNEDNTIYQIGSITKQFTGTAILQLENQRLLNVEDTLDKYFPDYDAEYLKTVTISQLLQMTAGFGDYMATIEGNEEILKNYIKAAGKSEDDAKKFIVSTIINDGIYSDPGTIYTYSNSSYYLLGIIIEQLSGMSYKEYLQKNFFDYAEMNNTYFAGEGKDVCKGYSLAQEKYISDKEDKYREAEGEYIYLFSAGSVVSNAEDVLRWLRVVTSNELFTANDRKKVEHATWLYNYGWNTGDYIWHHSGRTYAYSSQVYADYKTDTQLVILTNLSFYEDLGEISYKVYYPLVDAVKKAK